MKELESFRGHQKDVTALAWHPFHEEYFVSGSYDGSIFHWLVGNESPQVTIQNAHDNSVWDLAWHPIGYVLCSGSNDCTTKFWCRNRPGDPDRDKLSGGANQGYGDPNPTMGGRIPGSHTVSEPTVTPGPFGFSRNEGTIPGIGVAMPLSSLDSSGQGDQKPLSMSLGTPPLPLGPHPSLLAGNQQQTYQQNVPPHIQQLQSLPQQMSNVPYPSHLQGPHPNFPRPPPQFQPLNMPPNLPPSSMPGSLSISGMPNPMGGMNPMGPPLGQGRFMGMNPMGNMPPPVGNPNMQGGPPSNASGGSQMYQQGGGFNRPQAGQMPMMPGLSPYQQTGNPNAPGMQQLNFNFPSGIPSPLPPGPPLPHGQSHQ